MTVTLDKKQIHLGWEVAVTILIFTIGTTWAAAMYNSSSDQKQNDMLQSLTDIKKTLARQQIKDSIQDIRLDTLFSRQVQQHYLDNTIINSVNDLKESIRTVRTVQYFTEKKIRGQIHLSEVKR